MLSINMEDVYKTLETCSPYLIGLGIVLVLAIAAIIACRKLSGARKFIVRSQAVLAMPLALVIVVNLICFGPMNTLITLATGNGTISEQTSADAEELVREIAGEGIVLLENNDGLLPLSSGSKLNVFGWASTNPCYGGTGSGALNDNYPKVSLIQGLTEAGLELNQALVDFYTQYSDVRPGLGMRTQDWSLPEPPADTYPQELLSGAKEFSNTAMIVISRLGGEGSDLPTDLSADKLPYTQNSDKYKDFADGEHYLQLSQTEKDMINLVTASFDNVIVVYNGANAFELGFVEEYPQIKSVLWCPGPGQNGFSSLGSIVTGEVNPSAKTSDTFVYDLTSTPHWNNIGDFAYDNMQEFQIYNKYQKRDIVPSFVNYVENIYVGYKFYETAAVEGLIDYDTAVQYPFGYGLSYTTFRQTMDSMTTGSDGSIVISVTVTNTGDTAGKDVVEVYYNPPYTNGGIEKASANLIAFAKTELLEPGASQTLTLSFQPEEMASYDARVNEAYVLEAGEYVISINSDSHTVIDSETYTVPSTIVYGVDTPRSSDQTAAVNQLQFAEGGVDYLSRADGFANYDEVTKTPDNYSMPEEYKATFINNSNYNPATTNNPEDKMPTLEANNGLKLADLRGKEYGDPMWEQLLDQMSVQDMNLLISQAGFQTVQIDSIGKVATVDCDGPASINNNFTRVGSIGFPSAVMVASTWNTELARAFGDSIGKMADEMNVSGWYAPAMNIHRSAFCGRNFEYYSEDGVLSGKMAANAVAGAREHGVYAYLKHFVLNDQENNRANMLCTWASEQSIREIYLKPFELAIKEGGAQALMSSYNYIGNKWVGASSELLQSIVRGEWGFQGFVLTDYFSEHYMNADIGTRNGNDVCLSPMDVGANNVQDTSATAVLAMRQASKNILYTVVNSRAYAPENLNSGMPVWQIALIAADVILAAVFVVLEYRAVKSYTCRKVAETQAKQ